MALLHDLRALYQRHYAPPPPVKKHIWSEGWTPDSDPNAVAKAQIASFSKCYTDLEVVHLPTVLDSSTDAGKQAIIQDTGLADPTGPYQYFFYGLVLSGVRAKTSPDQECLYDSEL